MGGKPLAHVLAQFILKLVRGDVARLQHDERLDNFSALKVWLADHRCLHDGGMFDQSAFDIEGANAIA